MMRLKTLEDENFTNYKVCSMTIGTISCGGKCCIEGGIPLTVCLNDSWRRAPILEMDNFELMERYVKNPLTNAIVFAGLEPFEQFDDMEAFIYTCRHTYNCMDDIVIYTGYNKDEIEDKVQELAKYPNIIIKFGRFVPNSEKRFDDVLGVTLASKNQYAERIS